LTASGDLSHHLDNFPAPYATKQGQDGRTQVLSGTIWEDLAGFSRAVKKGWCELVFLSEMYPIGSQFLECMALDLNIFNLLIL